MDSYLWGNPAEVIYENGTPGQNNNYPASFFNIHIMLEYDFCYYDASYGLIHATEQSIDDTLQGFYKEFPSQGIVYFMENPVGNQIRVISIGTRN